MIIWEGAFLSFHSLSVINRNVVGRLIKKGVKVVPINTEPPEFNSEMDFPTHIDRRPDIYLRHNFPPKLERPDCEKFIIIQPWEYGPIPLEWVEPINRNVDVVLTPSEFSRKCFKMSGVKRVEVVPNGVDPEKFSPSAPHFELETKKSFRFLFVGGSIWRKGIDVTINAYLAAFSKDDDVCLVIKDVATNSTCKYTYYKSDMKEQIKKLSEDKSLAEILYLDDDIPDEKMPSLYTSCHVLLHPFRGEGFGMPILEALMCGLPVIATGFGAPMDFLRDDFTYFLRYRITRGTIRAFGDVGILVDFPFWAEPDFVHTIDTLWKVRSEYDKAKDRVLKVRNELAERFSWDRIAESYIEKFENITGKTLTDTMLATKQSATNTSS